MKTSRKNAPRKGPNKKLGIGAVDRTTVDINGKPLKSYTHWRQMIYRCYNELYHKRRPTYMGCEVCTEWLTFGAFQDWFDANYRDGYQLDKDILYPGNKVYGPEVCRYVPAYINSALGMKSSDSGLPPGVRRYAGFDDKYIVHIGHGKVRHVGIFDSIASAFTAYKKEKRIEIAHIASRALLAGHISIDIYYALIAMPIRRPS